MINADLVKCCGKDILNKISNGGIKNEM